MLIAGPERSAKADQWDRDRVSSSDGPRITERVNPSGRSIGTYQGARNGQSFGVHRDQMERAMDAESQRQKKVQSLNGNGGVNGSGEYDHMPKLEHMSYRVMIPPS